MKRKKINFTKQDGTKTTKNYARYILEQNLGRPLLKNEEADHIDNDFTNDNISNLQILTKEQNIAKSQMWAKRVTLQCIVCQIIFKRRISHEHGASKQRKLGPFCSHSCVAKYHNHLRGKKCKSVMKI